MKQGFVYIWYDRKHNRFYIGSHWGYEDDGYICSSRWMRNAYRRRPFDFKRRILARVTSDRGDLLAEEYRWLQMISKDDLGKRYYNLTNHLNGHWTTDEEKTKTVRQKLSDTMKLKHSDPGYQKIYEDGRSKMRGRKQTPEAITKRAAAIKAAKAIQFPPENRRVRAVKGSPEHTTKLSQASKKRWAQPEAKEKQAAITRELHIGKQHRLGHKNSPEHTAKIVAANTGKKRTPEQVERMRQTKLGKKATEEQRAARSIRTKQMWADRKAGIIPMPNYCKHK